MEQQTTFQTVLEHLLDSKKDFPRRYLQQFSDIDPKSLRLFLDTWKSVKPARKLFLLDELIALLDSDKLVSYDEIGRALLDDSDGDVRARAIRLLAESDDPKLAATLIGIFLNDADLAPRIEAAGLLGEFVQLGELDELPEELQRKVEDVLIKVANGEENPSLRRRALEALGFSSRPETETIISSAFHRQDPAWIASALTAMGRSADDRWAEEVIGRLLDENPRIRFAAVEAAGNLILEDAGPILINMLEEEDDDDVTSAAIWSLSQIGGEDARIYIETLIDQTEDEEIIEFLESALENLNFNEELNSFNLLSLDEDDLDEDADNRE